MIGNPLPHELTQGTIFTCAVAEDYPDVPVFGIIITARCDVAHGKAAIFSYVPLVSLEDWLLQDGRGILAARAAAAANGAMKSAISDAGLSASILQTLSHAAISAELSKSTDKAGRAISKRFDGAVGVLGEAKQAALGGMSAKDIRAFISGHQKPYNQLAQDLLSNSIAEFHYVDRSEPAETCNGFVALLREIRFMPATAAQCLLSGIDVHQFAELCSNEPKLRDKLSISSSEHYAMPVGLMLSPYIELFMQRLTQLFSRIGVTDYPPDKLHTIRALVPFKVEAE